MDIDFLIAAVSMLVVLSGAAERLVEVIKGFIPALNGALQDPVAESRRKAWVQTLTIAVCLVTAFITRDLIMQGLGDGTVGVDWRLIMTMGVLSAGGSSLWNSVLTYLVSAKDIKKAEATDLKATVEQHRAVPVNLVPPQALGVPGSKTR
jgi:hypothetical protein